MAPAVGLIEIQRFLKVADGFLEFVKLRQGPAFFTVQPGVVAAFLFRLIQVVQRGFVHFHFVEHPAQLGENAGVVLT